MNSKASLLLLLGLGAIVTTTACDPEPPPPDRLHLRQLNKGPAGTSLTFVQDADSRPEIANTASLVVGSALAIDCDENVQQEYRSQCTAMVVKADQPIVQVRQVYRPTSDASLAATSAFALVGVTAGTTIVHVTTAHNSYDFTVHVRP
jgi:hypothetical protein